MDDYTLYHTSFQWKLTCHIWHTYVWPEQELLVKFVSDKNSADPANLTLAGESARELTSHC